MLGYTADELTGVPDISKHITETELENAVNWIFLLTTSVLPMT